jgi:hypothetical protein
MASDKPALPPPENHSLLIARAVSPLKGAENLFQEDFFL